MTLAVRPTFSESWYRVKTLKVKLRASAQVSRQYYRGERWYVVRDPAGNQFHRLSDSAYRFIGLLDGRRSVQEAWDLCGGHLADDAPTQPEVIQILTHLYGANLIDADVTPDAAVLLRRHKKQQERRWRGRAMNVLFPRIPLWDPDTFLTRWMPVVRKLFSRWGAMLWILLVVVAIATVAPMWPELRSSAANAISPSNWAWLWAVFVLIKLIHELGHAFACRRFGGECHELGIMFLVFIPTPYVDASTAWSFPNKWAKVFVGAAGMIVELAFASIAAFIWFATYGSGSLVNQLAYNAMLVASVTTIVFNANPLLRYDGYYILSDLLEIPNLRQKSTEYALGLIKRHIYRVKPTQPLPPVNQRGWLLSYAVFSGIYRMFVGIIIILVVTTKVPILGVLMAMGGVMTWLVMPVGKTAKYLALDPELHRKRAPAVAWTLAATALAAGLIGFWPVGVNIRAQGYVEPASKVMIKPEADGFFDEILVKDGDHVKAGDVLVRGRNDEYAAQIAQLRADVRIAEYRRQAALQGETPDIYRARIEQQAIDVARQSLERLEQVQASLVIRSPIDGQIAAPNITNMTGRFVARGQEIGMVSAWDRLDVRTVLNQADFQVVQQAKPMLLEPSTDPRIEVRFAGDATHALPGTALRLFEGAQSQLPHASLGQAGGGEFAADPRDNAGTRLMQGQFEARIAVDNQNGHYMPGQRATVRFELDSRPLAWQLNRRFWQMVQRYSDDRWI